MGSGNSLFFFRFFRSRETTISSAKAYKQELHLSWGDVAMDDHTLPTSGARNLKRSKTDQFGKGAKIFLGRTDCPIHIHTSSCCSFQLNCKPRYCTRSRLQIQQWSPPHKAFVYQAHKDNLQELHKDSPIRNLRDSFHIGAATETAKRGVEDLIKTLRRWGGGAVQHTSGCHWNS